MQPAELTPEDIEQAAFSPSLRGYDRDEVDAFLAAVADQMRALMDSSRSAYKSLGDEVSGLLEHARETADRIIAEAHEATREIREKAEKAEAEADEYARRVRAEADQYVEARRAEAEEQARRIIEHAHERIDRLEDEEARLRERVTELVAELRALTDRLEQAAAPEPVTSSPLLPGSDDEVLSEPDEAPGPQPAGEPTVESPVVRFDDEGPAGRG